MFPFDPRREPSWARYNHRSREVKSGRRQIPFSKAFAPAALDLCRMPMIAEAGAGQITLTIIMMPSEISYLKRAALAGIYSAAWRRLARANDRRASIG